MEIIKETKFLQNKEESDPKIPASTSSKIDESNSQDDQTEAKIVCQEQPILVKRLKKDKQTEVKLSVNEVLNRGIIIIDKLENISLERDPTDNDSKIIEQTKEEGDTQLPSPTLLELHELEPQIDQAEIKVCEKTNSGESSAKGICISK